MIKSDEIKRKKKLAFSCAGEGFGHIARIVALSEQLRNDYDIIYFVPASVQGFLQTHLGIVKIVTIPTFHFVLKNHGVDYLKTCIDNISYIINFDKIVQKIKKQLIVCNVDALICDFEPFVSRAAVSLKVPLMNFSHPGILIKTLPFTPSGIISRAVSRFMTPGAQVNAFCSFYNGEVGPIIRKEIRDIKPETQNYFLVYTKKDSKKKIIDTIQKFPDKVFEVYPREKGNFAQALAKCKGVIAPAGHQLISEALFLGKPILAFPQKGQYEQKINARMLKKSGRGMYGKIAYAEKDMRKFFDKIECFPFGKDPFERFCFIDDTQHIIKLIHSFVSNNIKSSTMAPIYTYTYFDAFFEKMHLLQEQLDFAKSQLIS